MLGLYLDTLIIGHTFCSMLSILNELTLQKGIAKMTNDGIWTRKVKQHQHNKVATKNNCQS